jgi:hypothetical protein
MHLARTVFIAASWSMPYIPAAYCSGIKPLQPNRNTLALL